MQEFGPFRFVELRPAEMAVVVIPFVAGRPVAFELELDASKQGIAPTEEVQQFFLRVGMHTPAWRRVLISALETISLSRNYGGALRRPGEDRKL
jgi:hypothetical protein